LIKPSKKSIYRSKKMADYRLVITNAGLTKLANANINGVQLHLTQYSVGDGVLTPALATASLASEKYRANLNAVEIDNGVATIDCVLPTEIGGWYVRECGLWDSDGDLFASCVVPASYKVAPSEGAAKSLQIRLRIAIGNAESIAFETDETIIYATQDWTLDKIAQKVALTGAETINGVKTFASAPVVPDKSFTSAKIADVTTDATIDNAAFAAATLTFPVFLQRIWRGITGLRARLISAGVGLSGGGNLSADRSIALGTPSSVTGSSENAASGTTHNKKNATYYI
jgi:phage-related tail fiber protein